MMALLPDTVNMFKLNPDISKLNIGVLGLDPRTNASMEFGIKIIAKFDSLLEDFLVENVV